MTPVLSLLTPQDIRWTRTAARSLAADASLRLQWDRINGSMLDLPFMSAASVAAALQEFGTGRECLCTAYRGGTALAMALVVPKDAFRWTLFQPSQLPLGAWVCAPSIALEPLASSLLNHGLSPWAASVSFMKIDPLQSEAGFDTAVGRFDDYIQTAWLNIDGRFDDYWADRGKNLRQNMRKQRNKLGDEGITPTVLVWRDAAQMAAAVARYAGLEGTGWKVGKGTAVQVDNAQGRYYTRLLEDAAQRGEALVTEYRFGEQTVAMNLGLLRKGVWTVLKTAYDETVTKALSPASLLREDELKLLFDSGEVRRIEYYGRVMEWHTRLTDQQRTLFHYTAYRFPWVKRYAMRKHVREREPDQPIADSMLSEVQSTLQPPLEK